MNVPGFTKTDSNISARCFRIASRNESTRSFDRPPALKKTKKPPICIMFQFAIVRFLLSKTQSTFCSEKFCTEPRRLKRSLSVECGKKLVVHKAVNPKQRCHSEWNIREQFSILPFGGAKDLFAMATGVPTFGKTIVGPIDWPCLVLRKWRSTWSLV